MALITMRDVTIAFEGVAAIEHVNLSIERGDYLVIVGENGSGKSTLMRAILGLVRPHSGQVLYGDGLRRSQIGYLPQQTAAQRDFPASVEEVVMSGCINRMGRRLFFAPAQRKLAEEKMRMMDVEKFRRKPYRVLSGGQQQRRKNRRAPVRSAPQQRLQCPSHQPSLLSALIARYSSTLPQKSTP